MATVDNTNLLSAHEILSREHDAFHAWSTGLIHRRSFCCFR